MFNQDEFFAYLGVNGSNNSKKPAQQRGPRKSAPKPVTKPVPAVSKTFVSPGGLMVARAVAAVVPVRMVAPVPVPVAAPAVAQATPEKPLEMVPYSDKSFAIYGDTKPIQKQLEALGGSFNRWLKRDGVPTPGFIFSNKRAAEVRKALNL
jgi:hypothetical protein